MTEERRRVTIPYSGGNFEAWVSEQSGGSSNRIFAIKFPGTGGRAERSGPHPCEIFSHDNFEVWTVNPPGYGGSDGRPSLKNMVETCQASWNAFFQAAGDQLKIAVGNSLGCMSALYVAANYPIDGLFIRNPVPLTEYIVGRYGWELWVGSKTCHQFGSGTDGRNRECKTQSGTRVFD